MSSVLKDLLSEIKHEIKAGEEVMDEFNDYSSGYLDGLRFSRDLIEKEIAINND